MVAGPPRQRRRRRRRSGWRRGLGLTGLVACGALALVAAGLVGGVISARLSSGAPTRAGCAASAVAERVLPSVVTIAASGPGGSSTGSGEVMRADGYILTNEHVIAAGANGGGVQVLFSSGRSVPASIVGQAAALDLAVLKVTGEPALPAIGVARSEDIQVGQPVVAIGAPLGLSGTVTAGIVSAVGRDVSVPASDGGTLLLPGALQTDASINPGNSGGPLVDCSGRLIGVNTAIATVPNASGQSGGGSVGIGFAIPSDLATAVTDQLISRGRFAPPFFGVSTVPIPPFVADTFHVTRGLFVQAVAADGPAARAGLRVGDVITAVAGRATTGPDSIYLAVLDKGVGDQVGVSHVRDRQPATTTLTLGASP